MASPRTRPQRRARRATAPASGASIDALALEVLRGLGRLAVDCGLSREQLTKLAVDAFAELPEPEDSLDPDVLDCLGYASHVLTHWHTEPDYLDARGLPRVLPLRGKRSITSLALAASPRANVAVLLRVLTHYGALRKQPRGWLPTSRSLMVTGQQAYRSARGLLLMRGLLRNKAHNAAVLGQRDGTRDGQGWFERVVDNAHIPVAQRSLVYRNVEALGAQFLAHLDLDMKRREQPDLPAGDKAHVSVGVYLFEESD